jgi:hypothetical protein
MQGANWVERLREGMEGYGQPELYCAAGTARESRGWQSCLTASPAVHSILLCVTSWVPAHLQSVVMNIYCFESSHKLSPVVFDKVGSIPHKHLTHAPQHAGPTSTPSSLRVAR